MPEEEAKKAPKKEYPNEPKRPVPMCILNILKEHSDGNHPLSRMEITDRLRNEYSIKVDPKTVVRHIRALKEAGFTIEPIERTRKSKDGLDEDTVCDGYYFERDIDDSELRLLIDSLLFSKYIHYSQCEALIKKLEATSSKYFKARTKHIKAMPVNETNNKQLFYTIDILDEAMEKGNKVSFHFIEYGPDKKPYLTKREDGSIWVYTVSPYQMVVANSRYYLICSHNKGDEIFHYRIDYIKDIKILEDTTIRPMSELNGLEHGLQLSKHMAEHIYMYSGPSKDVTFRAPVWLTGSVLDWFGKDVKISDIADGMMTVKVTVNEKAMLFWALQFGKYVKVLEPSTLRDSVREAVEIMCENYGIKLAEPE